ncbi:DUF441 domain-containing protein [Thermosediminibacter oceani]|uniref:UPF0756 membrane protein Toce_2241 n=1 Tax=Thermosediminibacter oceani (strain ATCC BAA-1034 / DSM 16646 / JW/IW-1228P) TaxID=555079 RepID=D9S173_THEOJ|nr:DUF441 domain-containing protein [Thermosediminibacter oceani]ADL08952.1 protein of unknown function DUF441 [Thermosediminibacter oceani DSM 16646]
MKPSSIIFLILALGYLGKNRLILVSSGVLLLFSYLGLLPKSTEAQNIMLDLGVILLVMGILLPLSTGEVYAKDVYRSIFTLEGLVIFLVGIASAVMARDGVDLLKENPGIMICLLMGSIVGTAFFKGLPTGPLVAAGLAAFIINLLRRM